MRPKNRAKVTGLPGGGGGGRVGVVAAPRLPN